MTDDSQPELPANQAEQSPKTKKTRAKKSAEVSDTAQPAQKAPPATAKTRKASAKKSPAKSAAKSAPKKKTSSKRKPVVEPEEAVPVSETAPAPLANRFEDPIGDVSDGEGATYSGADLETDSDSEAEAYRSGVAVDAVDGTLEGAEPRAHDDGDAEAGPAPAEIAERVARGREREAEIKPRPPAKLERLQKILSQAGIASRRHAEEMIVAGRVMVNGQVVTALGSKADPQQDHIRVDGKLLHGAERHRYFVLNKPKGYVTTVSDPEGRPTVMDFVQKLGERVYPVGRLDFQSEGLLLMTNDGALANKLTHASSGVEKTYVVKIAGQPDEEKLERLRAGVMIERGGPTDSALYGAGGRVRTAPARIRQIRPGNNPWFEVVLTEGRNRELRKMFATVGHYVEKIRRVGYGPLALDLEPGKLRELTPEEVDALRLTAEGKLKPRRVRAEAMLPKEAGRSAEERPHKRESGWRGEARPGKPYAQRSPERSAEKPFRRRDEERPGPGEERGRPQQGPRREFQGERREWQPRPRTERPASSGPREPRREFAPRYEKRRGGDAGRGFGGPPKRAWGDAERPSRNEGRPAREDRGRSERPFRAQGPPAEARGKNKFGAASKFPSRSKFGGERAPGGSGRPGGFQGERGARGPGKPGAFQGERGARGPGRPGAFRGERDARGPGKPGGFQVERDARASGKPGGFQGQRGGRGPGRPGGFRSGPPRGGRPGGGKRRG